MRITWTKLLKCAVIGYFVLVVAVVLQFLMSLFYFISAHVSPAKKGRKGEGRDGLLLKCIYIYITFFF